MRALGREIETRPLSTVTLLGWGSSGSEKNSFPCLGGCPYGLPSEGVLPVVPSPSLVSWQIFDLLFCIGPWGADRHFPPNGKELISHLKTHQLDGPLGSLPIQSHWLQPFTHSVQSTGRQWVLGHRTERQWKLFPQLISECLTSRDSPCRSSTASSTRRCDSHSGTESSAGVTNGTSGWDS